MENTLLYKKVYGCLAAGAIGDTFGRPVEGWHYKDIEEKKGRLTDPWEKSERTRGGDAQFEINPLGCQLGTGANQQGLIFHRSQTSHVAHDDARPVGVWFTGFETSGIDAVGDHENVLLGPTPAGNQHVFGIFAYGKKSGGQFHQYSGRQPAA